MGSGIFKSQYNLGGEGTFECAVALTSIPENVTKAYRCKVIYPDTTEKTITMAFFRRGSLLVGRTAALEPQEILSFSFDITPSGQWYGVYTSLNPSDVGTLILK